MKGEEVSLKGKDSDSEQWRGEEPLESESENGARLTSELLNIIWPSTIRQLTSGSTRLQKAHLWSTLIHFK